MMNKSKIVKILFVILILFASSASFAQDFEDDVIDNTPAGPIDNYVILTLFLGMIYAFYKMKRVGCEKVFR